MVNGVRLDTFLIPLLRPIVGVGGQEMDSLDNYLENPPGRKAGTMVEQIEAFRASHLDECARLLMATFNAEPWNDNYTLDTAGKQLAWILGVPGCVGLVSIADGVVAFAIGYREPTDVGDIFYLSIFCVRPDAQRTGVGSRLLGHLEEYLGKRGVKAIHLGTDKGTPAEAFYKKNGYIVKPKVIVMTQEL
jgi:aminoglycoside 6'-N-acetyltransferase I